MNRDFLEFIEILKNKNVDFVIIGGMALAFYGYPRFTGDLDIWVIPTLENIQKVFLSIQEFFGTKLKATPEEFLQGKKMISLGEEPVKIEIHQYLDGLTAEEIWNTRIKGTFGNHEVFFIGRDAFIKNKKAVGRDQDLVDVKRLEKK